MPRSLAPKRELPVLITWYLLYPAIGLEVVAKCSSLATWVKFGIEDLALMLLD